MNLWWVNIVYGQEEEISEKDNFQNLGECKECKCDKGDILWDKKKNMQKDLGIFVETIEVLNGKIFFDLQDKIFPCTNF